MTLREIRHSVWLRSDRVGTLVQRGDHTRFVFSQKYFNNPGVSPQREMELLAQVGHDLPGAVRVLPALDSEGDEIEWLPKPAPMPVAQHAREQGTWRFSLAGVALKFSMLAKGDRLTLPACGVGGDWIVKLPDQMTQTCRATSSP